MKECWYCHKMEMCPDGKLGKGWSKCANCGATEGLPLPKNKGSLRQTAGQYETYRALTGRDYRSC